MIAVVLEGGLVSAIISDDLNLHGQNVLVIDYDTDDNDPAECEAVKQSSGDVSDAYCHFEEICSPDIDLHDVAKQVNEGETALRECETCGSSYHADTDWNGYCGKGCYDTRDDGPGEPEDHPS